MSKKVIIFTNELGCVSICTPTGELSIEQVQIKDCPADSYIVETNSLPEADADFFNAWEQTNGVVTVNLDKAKNLTKERLRIERAPLLAAQDIAFQRALESGADTSAIVAEKERLRNLPTLADWCNTLDQLRQLKAGQ